MNFSTDRDLLVLEPNLFWDVPMLSQQRVRVTDGVVSGTTLTSVTADFVGAQVDVGGVVMIGQVPHEVLGRTDAHTLTVSLLRDGPEDAAIPPQAGTGFEVVVRTFSPQAALVHDVLLRLVGIESDDPGTRVGEEAVLSQGVMANLEALGTLERVYSAARALVGDNGSVAAKAEEYRRRFHAACRAALVLLDLDGDGYADVRRELGVVCFSRV